MGHFKSKAQQTEIRLNFRLPPEVPVVPISSPVLFHTKEAKMKTIIQNPDTKQVFAVEVKEEAPEGINEQLEALSKKIQLAIKKVKKFRKSRKPLL